MTQNQYQQLSLLNSLNYPRGAISRQKLIDWGVPIACLRTITTGKAERWQTNCCAFLIWHESRDVWWVLPLPQAS